MSSTGLITSALPSFHLSISPFHPLTLFFYSVIPFLFFRNPSSMLACYNLLFSSIHRFVSLWFIHLFNNLSLQKTFVCFSLVALLPNQAGTESYRLHYYLTHTVKMNSSSHIPGCPRRVGEINFIFYLPKLLLTRHWLYNPAVVFTEMGLWEVDRYITAAHAHLRWLAQCTCASGNERKYASKSIQAPTKSIISVSN